MRPFDAEQWARCVDETLPPDYIKILGNGEASVFRLDMETERAVPTAKWPEDVRSKFDVEDDSQKTSQE